MIPDEFSSSSLQKADAAEKGKLNIDYQRVKKVSLILRAINHKLRQQILKVISEAENLRVTEIYVRLRLDQSVVSQHLGILRTAGIVAIRREGKFIYYMINSERLEAIKRFVKELLA